MAPSSYGQCPNDEPAQSISYNTGFDGGGNDIFNFVFPQFDPSIGTLIKVDIETLITLKYTYTLENTDNVPINYRVRAGRTDGIYSSALLAPLSTNQINSIGFHSLSSFDGIIGSGADYVEIGPVYALNKYPINYSLNSNIAGFLGNGNVSFDYETITYSYPTGSSSYLFNTSANDSMTIKLTYYYCATGFLPADIKNFTANTEPSGNIHLSWFTPNDYIGKQYFIEKSQDGKNFTNIESIISNSNTGSSYQTTYKPVKEDKNKIFFRIKQLEQNGAAKYSDIRNISFPEKSTRMKVYPTVSSNYFSIYFPNTAKEDWQVNVISLSGQLMQQSNFAKTNFIRLNFNQHLPAGIYIIEAVNKKKQESQKSKIIVE